MGRRLRAVRTPDIQKKRARTGMMFVAPCTVVVLLMMIVPILRTVSFAFFGSNPAFLLIPGS